MIKLKQLILVAVAVVTSCGQNSHMTMDAAIGAADITAPVATISGGASGSTNTALQTITVTFSEAVVAAGISAGDFNITNGVLSNLNCLPAVAPTACTFDVTASGEGPVSVVLPASAVQDTAGNSNDASNVIAWSYDSVGPTVSIAVGAGEPLSGSSTNDSSIALTLTSSEALAGLVAGDFTCTNCTVSGISGSGTNWTVNVIPSGPGAVSVELAASAVQDGAGNSNVAASNNLNWNYNNVAPALTLAPASGAPASGSATNTSPIAVELSSSAVITGLVSGDIVCTNCTISNFSGSADAYTFEVTPSGQGDFSVNVPASVAQDAATNQNTASNTLSWTYDTSAPSATLAVGSGGAASGSTTSAASIPVEVVMGESVTGLVAGDFTCTNCTLSGFSGSGASYSFNVVPTASGAVSVQLPAGRAADAAGNGNTLSNSLAWTFDNTAPTVVLSGAPVSGTANSAQTITVTFSESMNVGTLSSADVSVTNGSVSAFSCSGSPTACTFTVTPTANGTVTVAMAASVAQDNAGNNNTAATNISWTHDATAPTVVISSTASSPTATSPIPIALTWSELISVASLVEGDLVIGNGTVDGGSLSCSNLPLVSPTYTKCSLTITPTANGTVTVNLAANRATDLAGNGNTVATQFNISYSALPADTLGDDQCRGVAVDGAGNVYCAGYTSGSLAETNGGSYDFFVVKFDSAGDIDWIRQAGASGGYTQSQIATLTSANGGGDTTNYDVCNGVAVDGAGNVYCAGNTYGSLAETNGGGNDFFVVKFDSAGDVDWIRQAGASGGYTLSQIDTLTSTNGGGYASGDEYCNGVAVDSVGNVYCAGATQGNLAETTWTTDGFLVVKFNSAGDIDWIRQAGYGGYTQSQIATLTSANGGGDTTNFSRCMGVAVDSAGNVYCAGVTGSSLAEASGGSNDFFVVKFDSAGDIDWIRQAGASGGYTQSQIDTLTSSNGGGDTTNYDVCNGVAVDSAGNVYCAGETGSSLAEASGGSNDFFVVKFDSAGDVDWIRQAGYGGYTQSQIATLTSSNNGGDTTNYDVCSGVAVDNAGNVYCAGVTGSSLAEANGGEIDFFVMKFNSAGDIDWIRQAGAGGGYTQSQIDTLTWSNGGGGDTTNNDVCSGVAVDSVGNVYCAGATQNHLAEANGGPYDFFVMKLDSSGDIKWIRQAGASGGYTYSQIPLH